MIYFVLAYRSPHKSRYVEENVEERRKLGILSLTFREKILE